MALIHPDDQERIRAIHQEAYQTGEPYEMVERIVRPDGEVRYLSSNGQVVHDETGQPVRMRGTCIDITDRVRDEREREAAANDVAWSSSVAGRRSRSTTPSSRAWPPPTTRSSWARRSGARSTCRGASTPPAGWWRT